MRANLSTVQEMQGVSNILAAVLEGLHGGTLVGARRGSELQPHRFSSCPHQKSKWHFLQK